MTRKPFYAFIDASNLFYGGEKSLGWKVDYKKLIQYIKRQYKVTKVYYYGGVELEGFGYSPLTDKLDLKELLSFLKRKLRKQKLNKTQITTTLKNIQRVKFYLKLKEFGYKLNLKPVKIFKEPDGRITKKANCDVDMTFEIMRFYKEYSGVLVLTGDGDFLAVLKYLKETGKTVKILARGERTAREIRQLAGGDFRDFVRLRPKIEYLGK